MPPDLGVLAFDTSAAHCAAALLIGRDIAISRHLPMEKGQAEALIPLLQSILQDAGRSWTDLTALAVGTGPGNFTGVRIAVAAARGLALGLGIPALGIPRFQAMAFGLPRPLTVIEDARRGQVYLQHFGPDGPDPARLAPLEEVVLVEGRTLGAVAPDLTPILPLCDAMAHLAALALTDPARPAHFPRPSPFYLRGADAAPPSDPPPVILP